MYESLQVTKVLSRLVGLITLYYTYTGEDIIKIPGVNPTFWLNHIFFTNPMQFDANVSSDSRMLDYHLMYMYVAKF